MKDHLLAALKGSLETAGLWRKNALLLAAVSGGGDSVALLYGLTLLRKDGSFRLAACHVQHGLRGESSRLDQQLTEDLCARWNVPIAIREAGLQGDMDTPGMETLAREKRRELFVRCMDELSADALLTAHHRDDQAETVLMHLLRGAGSKGLSGIAPQTAFGRGLLLRPLLALSKQELENVLQEEKIPFRHDESNDSPCTPRNLLRLELMPRLEALFPGAAAHLAAAAETLRQDEACLEALADGVYRRCLRQGNGVFALDVPSLEQASEALRLRALRRFYREGAALAGLHPDERELSRETSLSLHRLLQDSPGAGMNLPGVLRALRGQTLLHMLRQNGEALLPFSVPEPLALKAAANRASGPLTFPLPGGFWEITLAPPESGPFPLPQDANAVLLKREEMERCCFRTPLPGDTIYPFGAPGQKPLRRFLTDRRLDAPLRPALWLLAEAHRILWIPGLAASERLRRTSAQDLWQLSCRPAAFLKSTTDHKE